MPVYHRLGEVPRKRHTVFRQPDGGLYHEHLMGSRGFSGPGVAALSPSPADERPSHRSCCKKLDWQADPDPTLRMRHFRLARAARRRQPDARPHAAAVQSRRGHVARRSRRRPTTSSTATPKGTNWSTSAEGSGVLETQIGELAYRAGDYVVIPRGILHRYRLGGAATRLLVIESAGSIRPPNALSATKSGSSWSTAPIASATSAGPRRSPSTTKRASSASSSSSTTS